MLKGKGGITKLWAVDGHLCAAGVGYEVAVGSDWKKPHERDMATSVTSSLHSRR